MEANQPTTNKFALNYGILLGALGVVLAFMLYLQDLHYQQGFSNLVIAFVLTLGVAIVAMLQFRKANGGKMTFGQALKIGVGMSLISALITIAFNYILTHVIDPDTTDKAMAFAAEQMREQYNLTQEQIDAQLAISKKMSAPYIQIPLGIIFSVIIGFLASLVPALVLRKA
ncbi:DUF4199 domain-containing protein [Robiginitalea sp. M366]|uniref:DUF4199 domain-containing protein n=1 Tax=Robiginitalea aestuariiviva TaxID=3036903 RepID=UPI00240E4235|nr:DUF4199 domain-containing protein [Robiginitalea aestuariiviva]MDG1573472.1 DUF4199 domain-containing protein [Robiginitalea aestuariiviva]